LDLFEFQTGFAALNSTFQPNLHSWATPKEQQPPKQNQLGLFSLYTSLSTHFKSISFPILSLSQFPLFWYHHRDKSQKACAKEQSAQPEIPISARRSVYSLLT